MYVTYDLLPRTKNRHILCIYTVYLQLLRMLKKTCLQMLRQVETAMRKILQLWS
jgi:hypothetical protein